MHHKRLSLRRQTLRPLSPAALRRPRGGFELTTTQDDTMSIRNCPDPDTVMCGGIDKPSVELCHPSAAMRCFIPGLTTEC
jgi:hypothetical protein